MDTVRSWLDAKEVNRLAEGLLSPAPREVDANVEGLNSQVVVSPRLPEFSEDSAPKPSVKNALATALKTAKGSGMLQNASGGEGDSVVPDQSVKTGAEKLWGAKKSPSDVRELDLMLLLDLSEQWSEDFELNALVLMASDGEVLFDTLGNLKLTQMAQKLAKSATLKGNLFVRIGAGANLQVMPVSQDSSGWMLGVVVAKALSADQVEALTAEVSSGLK